MQTFLPFDNLTESVMILDRQRLGKQRVEVFQILNALADPIYGWQNHPAVKMWRGHELALSVYGMIACKIWVDRGYVDNTQLRILESVKHMKCFDSAENMYYRMATGLWTKTDEEILNLPDWFGGRIHETHRAMLYIKNPDFYWSLLGTFDPEITDYYWPVR